MFKTVLFLLCFLLANQLIAQYSDIKARWTFDAAPKEYLPILRGVPNASFTAGIQGVGCHFNNEKIHFNLTQSMVPGKPFAMGYWVQFEATTVRQAVFTLFDKPKSEGGAVLRLQLGIKDNRFYVRNGVGTSTLASQAAVAGEWYFLACVLEGEKAIFYLQGEEIFTTTDAVLGVAPTDAVRQMIIGDLPDEKAAFRGVIDEIVVAAGTATAAQVRLWYEVFVPPTPTPSSSKPQVLNMAANVPKSYDAPTTATNPAVANATTQCRIEVTSLNLRIEVWNEEEADEDRVSIIFNGASVVEPRHTDRILPQRRYRDIIPFVILPTEKNYITFVSTHTGTVHPEATKVGIRIWDGITRVELPCSVALNAAQGGTVEFVYTGNIPIHQRKDIAIRTIEQPKHDLNNYDVAKKDPQPQVAPVITSRTTPAPPPQVVAEPAVADADNERTKTPKPPKPEKEPKTTKPVAEKTPQDTPTPPKKADVEPTAVASATTTKPEKTERPVKEKDPEIPEESILAKPATKPATKPTPEPQYITIMDYRILDALVMHSTEVKIEITNLIPETTPPRLNLLLDDTKIYGNLRINPDKTELLVNLDTRKENVITLEAVSLQKGERCRLRLTVYNNKEVIGEYELRLDRYNAMIPMAYVPTAASTRPGNRRTVTVTDTDLVIQVRDNSKVDGDIITIRQDGINILENYMLTEELRDVPIKLQPNQENRFIFVPVSMGGSNTENTAWVQIVSQGRIIHEFSLRSQDANQPATLTIIHADN